MCNFFSLRFTTSFAIFSNDLALIVAKATKENKPVCVLNVVDVIFCVPNVRD